MLTTVEEACDRNLIKIGYTVKINNEFCGKILLIGRYHLHIKRDDDQRGAGIEESWLWPKMSAVPIEIFYKIAKDVNITFVNKITSFIFEGLLNNEKVYCKTIERLSNYNNGDIIVINGYIKDINNYLIINEVANYA